MPKVSVSVSFSDVEPKKVNRLEQLRAKLDSGSLDSWGRLGRHYREALDAFTQSELATNKRILERAQRLVKDSLLGKRFSGKQEFLAEMYKTLGFPKDHDHGDKYDAGELATNARLKLIYDTQYTRARAQIQRRDDIESGALKLFPAQELKRGGARKKPRDWKKRWQDVGGKLIEGRMVALVDDPIWARISRWGDPLPPFDYNSGMKLFKVSRANAIRLGLLPKPESAARKAKPDGGEKHPVPAPETPKAVNVAKAKLERVREAILGVPAPVEPPLSPAIRGGNKNL